MKRLEPHAKSKRRGKSPPRGAGAKSVIRAMAQADAVEQNKAITDILRVIGSSPADLRPVFDTILSHAIRLCQGDAAVLWQYDGGLLRFAASRRARRHEGAPDAAAAYFRNNPLALGKYNPTPQAALERRTVHVADVFVDRKYRPLVPKDSFRTLPNAGTVLAVPLLRQEELFGVITIWRFEKRLFTSKQVAMVETFAAQAAIAIHNVRLHNETREALEQQTATAEILRVISSSPGNIHPVLDSILQNALHLCEARHGSIFTFDGKGFHVASSAGDLNPDFLQWLRSASITPGRQTPLRRVGLELRPVHCVDLANDPSYAPSHEYRREGFRTALAVPLLKEGKLVGALAFHRREVRPFSDKQIALLETFADQAVIAIENVRLFNETKEALEQQTATAEILRVISRSPHDIQPVFDAILEHAMRLCDAGLGTVGLYDGKNYQHVAQHGGSPEYARWLFSGSFEPSPDSTLGRMIAERQPFHIDDYRELPSYRKGNPRSVATAELGGARTYLAVPLLNDGQVIGGITIRRGEVRPFTQKQIDLVSTFANQAVIAIENVRLFKETKEALEQQTATGEILRVMSSSPSDIQPVFDTVARKTSQLCKGSHAVVVRFDGEWLHLAAQHNPRPGASAPTAQRYPRHPGRDGPSARAVLERAVVHIPHADKDPELSQAYVRSLGAGSFLAVPLLREGRPIGAIGVSRAESGPFPAKQIELVKVFADQAVIAIENARLFNETKEALERQTATAEILKIIASSPNDIQPVLDAVGHNAARLCEANNAVIFRLEGGLLRQVAAYGGIPTSSHPTAGLPLDRSTVTGRAVVERQAIHVHDLAAEECEFPEGSKHAKRDGHRTTLATPLLREGVAIGAILIRRMEVRPFSDKQIALLQTFADQAVIAIENVRLFNETKEALEQQTAISEVLRVISDSPTDVKPVLDAVAVRAAKICEASDARIWLVEGESIRHAAGFGDVPMPVELGDSLPLERGTVSGRCILERTPLHIEDSADLAPDDYPITHKLQKRSGFRTIFSVPLMRESRALGAIMLRRMEVRRFSDKQIALLKTFADQAAIAIENVRLFNETREALERQMATGEILASISGSMTDTKPVFEAIVRNLLRLFGTSYAVVALRRGSVFELAGFQGEPGFERLEELYPLPVDEHTIVGEVVAARQVRRYTPVLGNPAVPRRTADLARQFGFNSMMAAPMMWKGEAIGGIVTARRQPLPFDDKQVALIQSFADQAVIAIENVRLFRELQARTEALTKSVSQLTALGEVGRAISSTLELDEVLRTIVRRAVQLAGLDGGSIYEFDERDERFHLRAAEHVEEEILEVSRKSPIRLGEGAVGRAGATREPVVVEDVLDERYRSRVRELLIKSGSRALLAVPLLREDHLLGALVVSRKSPGQFAPEVIELLKTFATQSAVAIQNARLFREIAEKSSQLEEASRHKSHFLASMSHELRTPLNAILGFNEMILGQVYGEVPSDMKEPLEDIQKSGKHLLRLINNVLDLAKIEAGRMELALADYSVPDTVESVRSTLRPLAEAKGLELVASVPEDIPLAYGDSGRLTQCLMNLAGNSLKFTKAGRVEISVEAKNGRLTWRVSDTGIGIPPDKIETLFSEFRQTDATIASEYGGTGLGLSITKKFVEMHGGRIWVESELGKGSAFTLEIPLRVTAPA